MKDRKPSERVGELEKNNPHHKPSISTSKLPSEKFRYLGREWRIFKRTAGPNASWYFEIIRGGKRALTSLQSSAAAPAIESAKILIDGARAGKLAEMRALLGNRVQATGPAACAVEKYLELYESTATGQNTSKFRHSAVLAFRRLAGEALPDRMDQLEGMFKSARERTNKAVELAADNTTRMSLKRSFNSELANAAAVFSEMAVFTLKEQLTLPDFAKLRELVKFLRFHDAKKTAEQYQPPTAAVLEETLRTWPHLPRNEFLAVGLALACGMRRGEIKDFAAWDWFEEHAGYLWANGRKGDFKDRTDVLRVQVLNPFYDLLMERARREGWNGTGLILTGNRSEFDRNISDWMKKLGWNTRKHLHSLRAWAGSLVYMKHGAAAACEFCRHADERTTKQFYGWMQADWHTKDAAVIVAGKPVDWVKAKVTPPPPAPAPGSSAS